MNKIVESIIVGDYVSATELFESQIDVIKEKKLVEMKKMVQSEAVYSSATQKALSGGKRLLTPGERESLSITTKKKRKAPPKPSTTSPKSSDDSSSPFYKIGHAIGTGLKTFAQDVGSQYFSEELNPRRKRMVIAKKKRVLVKRRNVSQDKYNSATTHAVEE